MKLTTGKIEADLIVRFGVTDPAQALVVVKKVRDSANALIAGAAKTGIFNNTTEGVSLAVQDHRSR